MFERFTDRARRVVVLAQEEARMLDHGYIGTEHLLLGLIHEGEGVAARALESLGIGLEAARQQVGALTGRGQQPPAGHIPFTPRAKRVLEQAVREAGQGYIGPEHLLLGLVREGEGVAAQVLVRLGADPDRVRQQVIRLRPDQAGQGAMGEGAPAGSRERAGPADDALTRIESADRRLAAIERWVGLRPGLDDLDEEIARARSEKESAIAAQDFESASAARGKEKQLLARKASREKEHTAGPSLADEIGRLHAELARLRAVLRDHGIEPGDDAT